MVTVYAIRATMTTTTTTEINVLLSTLASLMEGALLGTDTGGVDSSSVCLCTMCTIRVQQINLCLG